MTSASILSAWIAQADRHFDGKHNYDIIKRVRLKHGAFFMCSQTVRGHVHDTSPNRRTVVWSQAKMMKDGGE